MMFTGEPKLIKYRARVSLTRGGETVHYVQANYAQSEPIAVFMVLNDLGIVGPYWGNVELYDARGNTTYWYFTLGPSTKVLEVTRCKEGGEPLQSVGFSNTHTYQRYLDNLGADEEWESFRESQASGECD